MGSLHDANFVITDGTGGCHNDNLQCHQWWQNWHHENSWLSMLVPIWHQGISRANYDWLSVGPKEQISVKLLWKYNGFLSKIYSGSVVCQKLPFLADNTSTVFCIVVLTSLCWKKKIVMAVLLPSIHLYTEKHKDCFIVVEDQGVTEVSMLATSSVDGVEKFYSNFTFQCLRK